uniref:NADH-ubiquinone oxidoreductase chain 4 n=1 Tax=Ogadenus brumpti TaxID=1827023 RepID=A0A1P8AG06_9ACAR|nr:NADH dehydrogenase subunit 4 [Ogadenus brumpti]AMX74048.1 NADH dehydrogenase subunit 4 [Ogadenus brumpti]AMX74061.1 NADH dehydrogenase subunit 4 [Ogadenus brumpti]
MLMVVMMLLSMVCLFFFFSLVEVMTGMILIMFSLVMVVEWSGMWVNFIGEVFFLDLYSVNLAILSIWIGMLMLMASFNSGAISEGSFCLYTVMLVLFLVLCFSCTSLFGFFLFFESVLFPIIMLIFSWGFQPERLSAGVSMLFYTLFGSMPLLIFLLFSNISLSYLYLYWMGYSMGGVVFFMVSVAFMVKVPMFMFHLWLPKAHVEAPIAGSMILAGVLLKLGIYGLLRFSIFLGKSMENFSGLILSFSLLGGLVISLVCLGQVDLKALIAYSSVCHMGLVLGGLFSFNLWGVMGGLLMVVGHGLCSSGLFCLANIMYERFFTRSLVLLKGMGIIFPFFILWWFFFCVVNMAAPPSMNLVGEIFLMGSMLSYSLLLLVPLGFMTFLSACYSLYMFSYTQHGSGWWVMSVLNVSVREYLLIFLHFCPLVLWVLKMEMFMNWM